MTTLWIFLTYVEKKNLLKIDTNNESESNNEPLMEAKQFATERLAFVNLKKIFKNLLIDDLKPF